MAKLTTHTTSPPRSTTADLKAGMDWLADMAISANILEINENDQHVVYTVRLPIDLRLDLAGLLALDRDPEFGEQMAAFFAARVRRIKAVRS
jgi:hypothetical protein